MDGLEVHHHGGKEGMITTLIPAYNCEYTIAKVVSKALDSSDVVWVCDDGSTDSTAKILKNMACSSRRLIVLTNKTNQGKGSALRDLFKPFQESCVSDVFVTLDADDQHNPEEIPHLVTPILHGEADVTIGGRQGKVPLLRKIGLKILDRTSNMKDSQSGFRAYSYKVLKDIEITENGFGVDSEIIMLLKKNRYRIVVVPVGIVYNKYSHTLNPFLQGLEILFSIFVKNSALWIAIGILISLSSIWLLLDVIHTYEVYSTLALGKIIIASILANVGITQFYSGIILYIISRKKG